MKNLSKLTHSVAAAGWTVLGLAIAVWANELRNSHPIANLALDTSWAIVNIFDVKEWQKNINMQFPYVVMWPEAEELKKHIGTFLRPDIIPKELSNVSILKDWKKVTFLHISHIVANPAWKNWYRVSFRTWEGNNYIEYDGEYQLSFKVILPWNTDKFTKKDAPKLIKALFEKAWQDKVDEGVAAQEHARLNPNDPKIWERGNFKLFWKADDEDRADQLATLLLKKIKKHHEVTKFDFDHEPSKTQFLENFTFKNPITMHGVSVAWFSVSVTFDWRFSFSIVQNSKVHLPPNGITTTFLHDKTFTHPNKKLWLSIITGENADQMNQLTQQQALDIVERLIKAL